MKTAMMLLSMVLAGQAPGAGQLPAAKPTTLPQLVASPGYQANIARLFAELPSDVFQRCPSLVSAGSQVSVLRRVSFNEGYPVAGTWKQSFPVSGCGNDTVINIFFSGQPTGKIVSLTGVPGTTHADPVLQRDAYRYVAIAAQRLAAGCAALHVRDTRYGGPAVPTRPPVGGSAVGQPWEETWFVAACGQVIAVPVTFVPDATGTTIVTKTATATAR